MYTDVVELYLERFLNVKLLSRKDIQILSNGFEQTGSVADLPRSGRSKSVTTEKHRNVLVKLFHQVNHRENTREYEMPRTILKSIQKTLKLKLLKPSFYNA